jgi:SAM-dependent methyltransferase
VTLEADRRDWNALSRRDPMWAVCSVPGTRGTWDRATFFSTGEAEVAGIVSGLRDNGLLATTDRALDFGCGLGRLSRALAETFSEVIGVDISEEMVEQARALNADRPMCRFIVNPTDRLPAIEDASCDLVLSLIALQHVSQRAAIRSYIGEFVRVARPGGAIVFQLPTRVARRVRLHPRRLVQRLAGRVRGRPLLAPALIEHSMVLNALPEPEVRELLVSCGAELVAVMSDARSGSDAVPSVSYVAKRTR